MRWHPRSFGDERASADKIKRDGWREQGILVVTIADSRLTWPEKEFLRQIGEKLYGKTEILPVRGSHEEN
ncbi:MAG: hypothetical protein RBT70_00730 [Alphaproteobacteria bacterium]|jgi:hypothetical protein|nr:hypothetical protein [Alphaproteobacteria bacterium]